MEAKIVIRNLYNLMVKGARIIREKVPFLFPRQRSIFRPLVVIFACFNVFASWTLEILLISQGHLNINTTLLQKLTGLMNPKFGRHVEPSANVTDKSTTGVPIILTMIHGSPL